MLLGVPRTGLCAIAGRLGPPRQPQRLWAGMMLVRLGHGGLVLVLRWDGGCLREGVARWHGCRRNSVRMAPGGDLPAEPGEFAGDRDRDDPVGLLAGVFELAPAGVQASLRFPGDVDDLWRLIALAALERLADPGMAAVVVGRFDQQPPRVRRAGLRDRASYGGAVVKRVAFMVPFLQG